jgi:RND superfamily putative drug exporter
MTTQSPPTADNSPPARGPLARLTTLPSGKRAKWLIVLAWIIVVAVVSPFAAKLTDVQKNDATAWLPGNAESLKVSQLEAQFPGGDTQPAVVVYHRAGGLTDADRAAAEADRQALAQRFPDTPPSDVVPSEDGAALLYAIPLHATADDDPQADVKAIRAAVKQSAQSAGLDVKVTGPAGFVADLIDVFGGIDVTLLLASAAVVAVLLLFTYRSPFVWLVPLLAVAFANQAASGAVYGLAKHAGLTVNGQSGGILPVLVFGAGTDYALLLIARYREELRRHEDKHEAMAVALGKAGPAVLASGGTVIMGLLCLLAADLNSNRSLALVGALGIAGALCAMLTLLPAVLVIFGRRLFWPFVPRFGSAPHEESGAWSRIGRAVSHRPRPVWIGTAVVLGVLALGLFGLNTNLSQEDSFRNTVDSITGQQLLAASYPAGAGAPSTVIARADAADAVQAAISDAPGVASVRPSGVAVELVSYSVTLNADPSTPAAFDSVELLRERVHAVPNAEAIVGGSDAVNLDVAKANSHDRKVVMPLVLLVVLIILALLLRAIVAPVLLILTVVLSFAASLGTGVLVFKHIFHFGGVDPSIPLLAFVFLVALGIDYNIFLMSRVHEESATLGTRAGTLRGLAVTGGVITSAGLVLAATFAVLGVLPLVSMTELGFIVAFGVLLDTSIVRSVLVPALCMDLDRRIWWPSRLAAQPEPAEVRRETHAVTTPT